MSYKLAFVQPDVSDCCNPRTWWVGSTAGFHPHVRRARCQWAISIRRAAALWFIRRTRDRRKVWTIRYPLPRFRCKKGRCIYVPDQECRSPARNLQDPSVPPTGCHSLTLAFIYRILASEAIGACHPPACGRPYNMGLDSMQSVQRSFVSCVCRVVT